MMTIILVLVMTLTIILQIQVILSEKTFMSDQSMKSLESGFESLHSSMYMSTPFFFLSVLFVLFDLELIFYFPGIMSVTIVTDMIIIWTLINLVIFITLVIEWSFCGLKWYI